MSGEKVHKRGTLFQVHCSTLHGEVVCISGDCPELGNWKWDHLILLSNEPNQACGEKTKGSRIWSATVNLPEDKDIFYRYAVCVVAEENEEEENRKFLVIRRWEANILPRKIRIGNHGEYDSVDEFGSYAGHNKNNVELGWITSETVVQFKMYNSAIELWPKKYKNSCNLRLKMVPVPLSGEGAGLEFVNDFHEFSSQIGVGWPFIEIAVMNKEEHQMSVQHQFGRSYRPDEMIIFQAKVSNYKNAAYMVNFYMECENEMSTLIGLCHILPCNLKGSNGYVTLPIINVKQQPLGQMKVEYSVVTPLTDSPCDFAVSYTKYWPESWTGLDVGHRGSGNSSKKFKSCSNIRENTVASFLKAADHGADFVEFDVQLSKDLVPVLYHDFHVNICLNQRAKKGGQLTTLKTSVQDLTLKHLHDLKIIHESEEPNASDDDLEQEHDPFPTLQHVLETVPIHTGFNVEIKWSMLRKNGSWDGNENHNDLNLALDIILKTLFQFAGSRSIILSCFHPGVCSMLRLKQNRYPVLFLTQGITDKWPEYDDPRTRNIPIGIYHALSTQLLGLCIHTEEILRDPTQLKAIVSNGLIAFCWGDDNNDPTTIQYLKQLGVNGVIYDRIDDHMEAKKNIFEMEKYSLTTLN